MKILAIELRACVDNYQELEALENGFKYRGDDTGRVFVQIHLEKFTEHDSDLFEKELIEKVTAAVKDQLRRYKTDHELPEWLK